MNVNKVLTKNYESQTLGKRGKNKPNSNPIQTQSNPITEMPKMNVTKVLTRDYENKSLFWVKAKQTQFKPKQTQFYNPTCPQKHALSRACPERVEWAEGAATELRCRIPEITYLWQLQFMAHSGTIPPVNRVSSVWADSYKVSIRPRSIQEKRKECQR